MTFMKPLASFLSSQNILIALVGPSDSVHHIDMDPGGRGQGKFSSEMSKIGPHDEHYGD